MTAPLLEQLESITRNGRSYDCFRPNGTELEHRGHFKPVRLVFPCDLSNLDAALNRLPQNKPRMGFRLNINFEPWMLRPNGNWGQAKISRKDGKRCGWDRSSWFIHAQGLCFGSPGHGTTFYRQKGSSELPRTIRYGEMLAFYSQKLNTNPANIREFGLDSTTNCMCCGKSLTVNKSQVRGVGPECLSVLQEFCGTDKSILEMESSPLEQFRCVEVQS